MSEYAGDNRITSLIRFAEEAISSVPSIVVGLFGLIAFVNLTGWGFTALGGALALTLFNLPLMARLSEQAMRAVPPDERSASLALGATKWQTIRHVVLPLAIPGHRDRDHPDRRAGSSARPPPCCSRPGLSTPTHYDFSNLNSLDPQSPWSPLPAGDDPGGLHLEDELGRAERVRIPDRRRILGASCWPLSCSSTSGPGSWDACCPGA